MRKTIRNDMIIYISTYNSSNNNRWNHIIFGAFTVVLGVLCFFFLLDNPRSWILRLTEEEHKIVDKRTRDNAVIRNKQIKYRHFLEALKEPRLYLIGIASVCINMQNGGLLVFSAQIIRSLGSYTVNTFVYGNVHLCP